MGAKNTSQSLKNTLTLIYFVREKLKKNMKSPFEQNTQKYFSFAIPNTLTNEKKTQVDYFQKNHLGKA